MQLKQYAVDENLAENGRVIPLGKDASITVARMNNKNFNAAFNKLIAPYGSRVDRIDGEEKEEIYMKCFAQYVVLDWKGIYDGDDLIEYSPENVIAMFKKYVEFHNEILELARDYTVFVNQDEAEDLGNSAPPSQPS